MDRSVKRQSNIELLRIVGMLLIISHHYIVNSGIMESITLQDHPMKYTFLTAFGMWARPVSISSFWSAVTSCALPHWPYAAIARLHSNGSSTTTWYIWSCWQPDMKRYLLPESSVLYSHPLSMQTEAAALPLPFWCFTCAFLFWTCLSAVSQKSNTKSLSCSYSSFFQFYPRFSIILSSSEKCSGSLPFTSSEAS